MKDGSTITSQKDILKGIKDFYANLFSIHDGHSQHELLNDLDKAILLEGEITINELDEALSNMKNNKTPGLDGFPTDFFKVFLQKLKFFVLRALNESYTNQCLPLTMKEVVIIVSLRVINKEIY